MSIRCWQTAFVYLCLAFAARLVWASGPAGIKLDGTIGPSAAALAGPMYNISQNLGKLSGGNLFFSFQYFNVATGETALFTTTSAGINNVISRVTGGYASTIDGTIALQATSGAPNFFLINPSGVTFTSNAVIDVPAAFYVSTADYLKFSDGNFYVDPTKMSTLSAAAPEAFGFLGATRAPVNVEGALLSAGVNGAGDFQIVAGDATIDGGGATEGIEATTGSIEVTAVGNTSAEVPLSGPFAATDGTVTIRNGGLLGTQGQGSTTGGAIAVNAGSLLIDGVGLPIAGGVYTGMLTLTDTQGAGSDSAGSIMIAVGGDAKLVNGGIILSQSLGSGNAGSISLSANSLTIDGAGNANAQTGISILAFSSGSAGDIVVNVGGAASVVNGGSIDAETLGAGNAGKISVSAQSLTIDGVGNANLQTGIYDLAFSSGSAGDIAVNVGGAASIANDGSIAAQSGGSGNAGSISLGANSLTIDTGIISSLTTVSGTAGDVAISVSGNASFLNGGEIYAYTEGSANAANVSLSASSLAVNGGSGAIPFTGIYSVNTAGASGNSGRIDITVSGNASILNSGQIGAEGYGSGNEGQINLSAGSLTIDGGPSLLPTGLLGNAFMGSSGASANISVNVPGSVTVTNGGQISTSTYGTGNAGGISVEAAGLTISEVGFANANDVPATGILANTYDTGNAGQINLTLGSLTISGGSSTYLVGISSADNNQALGLNGSGPAGSGASGSIDLKVSGSATVQNGGQITTATYGSGSAGNVSLTAASLTIGGGANPSSVSSQAYLGSGGQTGQVSINTGQLFLESNGSIDISNGAVVSTPSLVAPTQMKINAQQIALDGGQITAASTGNVAASGIAVSYTSSLQMDSGTVSTTAQDGDGGPITIAGQGPLSLENSNITTSVSGTTNGNGGDIRINVPYIVFNTGAIQANTAAPRASGGNVTIDTLALIPTFQSFVLGGSSVRFDPTAIGLNVVQAAAPDGVSGTLIVTVPTLDLGNALLGLTGRPATAVALGRGVCGFEHGSSLAIAGRGGVAPTAYDPLWLDPETAWGEAAMALEQHAVTVSNARDIEIIKLIACR